MFSMDLSFLTRLQHTSDINNPVTLINTQEPRSATQDGIKPASDATAGSANIPAPTVVPATNEIELMS